MRSVETAVSTGNRGSRVSGAERMLISPARQINVHFPPLYKNPNFVLGAQYITLHEADPH